ncbi:MAG: hypothetical protein GY708_21685 [Actinomycetia bacterium]|nr:hypothetical protein [Actinomycetes bacterium]
MKAAVAKTVHRVNFGSKPAPRRDSAPSGRVPRVARMLAMAHKVDAKIRAGELRDLADAARAMELTRARVTQITNLLLLAPEIQMEILELPLVEQGRDPISERQLRPIVAEPDWQRQMELWNEVKR